MFSFFFLFCFSLSICSSLHVTMCRVVTSCVTALVRRFAHLPACVCVSLSLSPSNIYTYMCIYIYIYTHCNVIWYNLIYYDMTWCYTISYDLVEHWGLRLPRRDLARGKQEEKREECGAWSDVWYPISEIYHDMTNERVADGRYDILIWYTWCMMYDICYMLYNLWHMLCYMIHDVWYMRRDMWHVICDMWYAICDMRYVTCDMWYVICDMRRVACDAIWRDRMRYTYVIRHNLHL